MGFSMHRILPQVAVWTGALALGQQRCSTYTWNCSRATSVVTSVTAVTDLEKRAGAAMVAASLEQSSRAAMARPWLDLHTNVHPVEFCTTRILIYSNSTGLIDYKGN